MIEVLVTLVIVAIGLLGLAGLQTRLESSEMESYQRAQALVLLDDMSSRMQSNRLNAAKYAEAAPLTAPLGAGMDACPATDASSTRAQLDAAEWCAALQGVAETAGGNRLGAVVGGRGCVEDLGLGPAGDRMYRVTVAWQGLTPTTVPAEGCGAGSYNGPTGSACAGDLCRRAVSTFIRMANLR